jgi:flagellar biosynthesis protein FlhG
MSFNKISAQANKLLSLTKSNKIKSKTKVLTITSGKGGVGKSTISANIAYLMHKKGLKVAVFDADIGLSNLQVLFDTKPKKTFYDYFNGENNIQKVFTKTKYSNITLIAGQSGHQYTNISNGMVFNQIVNEILALNSFDVLIIDTGAGIGEQVQEFLMISDNILAVTTTDPSALTDMYALMKMVSKKKENLYLTFNFTKKYETGETISNSLINLAIKNGLNRKFMVKYIGNVCESKSISTTSRLRKLFTEEFEKELATIQLQNIVDNLLSKLR